MSRFLSASRVAPPRRHRWGPALAVAVLVGLAGVPLNAAGAQPAAAITAAAGDEVTHTVTGPPGTTTWSLVDPPRGMRIEEHTGVIYWTPTPDQVGADSVEVVFDGTTSTVVAITVTPGNTIDLSQAVFIAPDGHDRNGDGSAANPYATTKGACSGPGTQTLAAGTVIYYRGGDYLNPGHGSGNLFNDSIPRVSCSGVDVDNPLIIQQWGNERPKIVFDSFIGLRLDGDFVTLRGLEIAGPAAGISYQEALDHWWDAPTPYYYNGNGLVFNGSGVVLEDLYIHHAPAGCISSSSGGMDGITIRNNVLAYCGWWTIKGPAAISIVDIEDNPGLIPRPGPGESNVEITGNLVYGTESRLASHVFSKGFSTLEIDEGSSLLIKANDTQARNAYTGGFLVEDNFWLHNGKGMSLRWDDLRIRDNTMYGTGTTMTGGGAGLRSNGGTNIDLYRNAVDVVAGKNVLDTSDAATAVRCQENVFGAGGVSASSQILDLCFPSAGGTSAQQATVFVDPDAGDFRIDASDPDLAEAGADPAIYSERASLVASYGDSIGPTDFGIDLCGQISRILELATEIPAYESTGWSEHDGEVTATIHFSTTDVTVNPTEAAEYPLYLPSQCAHLQTEPDPTTTTTSTSTTSSTTAPVPDTGPSTSTTGSAPTPISVPAAATPSTTTTTLGTTDGVMTTPAHPTSPGQVGSAGYQPGSLAFTGPSWPVKLIPVGTVTLLVGVASLVTSLRCRARP